MITRLMRYLARLPLSFPRSIMVVSLVLTALAAVALPRLHVSTDRNLLAGKDNESFRRREEVNDLFGTSLVLVVVVEGRQSRTEVRKIADEIAAALGEHPEHVRDVFHKADIGFFESHALMFLPLEKLKQLPEVLERTTAAVELVAESEGLAELVGGLGEILEEAPAPAEGDAAEAEMVLEFFGDVIEEFGVWVTEGDAEQLEVVDKIWSAGPSMNSRPGDEGYLTESDDKSPPLAVLFIQPTSSSQAMEVVAPLTDVVRATVAGVVARYPGARVSVTGMPAIITDEMRLVTRDCVVAGFAAGLGVLLVFLIAFRSIRVTLFLVIPLGIGLVWTAGLTAVLYGHLTLITSYFAAVLFGLGVAFTIHIVARFHEALVAGASSAEAVELALTRAGPGVMVGGGTTALAFFAIVFSEFRGFAEMGVISGLGVSLILLTNLTVLPAALLLWHPGVGVVRRRSSSAGAFWVDVARSRVVVPLVALLAMLAGALLAYRIGFDYAVENMLPGKAESVVGMRILDERTDFSMNYSIALADSVEAAEAQRKRFEALPTVARAESLAMFVPPDQRERVEVLAGIDPELKKLIGQTEDILDERVGSLGKVTARSLAASVDELADTVEDLAFDAKRAGRSERESLDKLATKIRRAAKLIAGKGKDERARALEKVIFSGLAKGFDILEVGMNDKGFGVEDLPIAVRRRYQSADGQHHAVIIFPDGDIGERDFFYQHVRELLSVSPETTGHPVTHKEFTRMVHDGFKDAILLAAIAVLILILLDLRSPSGLALGLAPVLVGMGWTCLIMYLTGLKFNYANLMALPILIGTGVDYGVHLAHRARQEGSIRAAARTTGRAIALSGLTTLIGFGSLLLGNHWGVRSLGLMLVIGISSSLVAALVVLPGLVRPRKDPRGKVPD